MPADPIRYTLRADPQNMTLALHLAKTFVADYPGNHCAIRPERHGVGFHRDGVAFYAYGDARHVRVVQSERWLT